MAPTPPRGAPILHDPLTGLPGPALLADRVGHALVRRRIETDTTLLVVELRGVAAARDAEGSAVGDRVLVVLADRFRGALRPADTLARLGQHTLAVLLEDTDLAGGRVVAERLVAALRAGLPVEGADGAVSAHVGLTAAGPGSTADELLRRAGAAAVRAVDRDLDLAVHGEEVDDSAEDTVLRADLERALEEDELELRFLPTVDLSSGRTTDVEALVRWRHPMHGLLAPGTFLPDAVRLGLEQRVGSWVLREACRAGAVLGSAGGRTVSVNLSAGQLHAVGLVDEVVGALRDAGLPADGLVVETTGPAILADIGTAERTLNALRDHGVWIAVDDFGAGAGSLSYLAHMPVDLLKLDGPAVASAPTDPAAASAVQAVLELARSLGLVTVAEGVETAEQATWLREHGCDRGQGFLWSGPVTLDAVRASLGHGPDVPGAGGPTAG